MKSYYGNEQTILLIYKMRIQKRLKILLNIKLINTSVRNITIKNYDQTTILYSMDLHQHIFYKLACVSYISSNINYVCAEYISINQKNVQPD